MSSVTKAARADAVGPDLIQRIAQGEEDALAELYDKTSRMVYGLAVRIMGYATTAEEIALAVYMQVWRTASRGRSPRLDSLGFSWTIRVC